MKTIITIQHAQSVRQINGMVGSRTGWYRAWYHTPSAPRGFRNKHFETDQYELVRTIQKR